MLRKRSRPFQKDQSRGQIMADLATSDSETVVVHKARGSPFFTVPGLFVGLNPKPVDTSSSDSAKSPTSPLDFAISSPKLSWECKKVGLGLVDSLTDDDDEGGLNSPFSESRNRNKNRNILFGSQIQNPNPKPTHFPTSPKSLPKYYTFSLQTQELPKSNSGFFSSELKKIQLGSLILPGSLPIGIGDSNGILGEIELSEDYTCIISHGPNPKTTHIFGDYIVEECSSRNVEKNEEDSNLACDGFLRHCFSCKKELKQGEDVYIYSRGEKAFCSCNCRDQEILSDEEKEKSETDLNIHEEIFIEGDVISFLE